MKKRLLLGAVAALATLSPAALAADHQDGAQVLNDPSLDITDIYTWTDSGGVKLNLIMNVVPAASKTTSTFSNAGQYVFHLSSYSAYGTAAVDENQIICTFDTSSPQKVQCWLVNIANGKQTTVDYATGNATAAAGIPSVNGDFQVFTGPREDPFFFNLDGFKATIADVVATIPQLVDGGAFGPTGCPTIDSTTVGVLDTQLMSAMGGGPPSDHFANLDVLSIVIQLKTSAVTSTGHTVVGVWGSTHI